MQRTRVKLRRITIATTILQYISQTEETTQHTPTQNVVLIAICKKIQTHSWKNPAILMRICNSPFIFSSSFNESWNVLGSIFGKNFNAMGNANSINGTKTNILMGTKRNTSVTVRNNCFRSRRLNVDPRNVRPSNCLAVRTSAQSNFEPM